MSEHVFAPQEPFPLIPEEMLTYDQALAHAEAADQWLGLRTSESEAAMHRRMEHNTNGPDHDIRQQFWMKLPFRSLQTPFTEIRLLLSRLEPAPGDTMVDLGAAYGRMGFVLGRHYPDTKFLGYEAIPERVAEGNRCLTIHAPQNRIIQADLASPEFAPMAARFYFIYDYGSVQAIEKTLNDLRTISLNLPITVTGRGRGTRNLIERNHPWLSQIVQPFHGKTYSIYHSRR